MRYGLKGLLLILISSVVISLVPLRLEATQASFSNNTNGVRQENQNPLTVSDGLGRAVTVRATPRRIVSTAPSNTETLYDLGLKDKIIAVTSHCGKTCGTSGKTIIGGWAEKTIAENIVALKPDLVVAFGGLQEPLAAILQKKNIPVFVFFPKTVDETLDQILRLGQITGTAEHARGIVWKCRNNLERIEKTLQDIPMKNRVRCVRLMPQEIMITGGTSFQNDIIKKAGGVNVFEDVREDYALTGLDRIAEKDPDVIILNGEKEKEAVGLISDKKGWGDLRAVKERKLICISCDYICHPNSRIDKTIEMIARRLYPERF